jgi:hypothetical protein
VEKRIPPGMVTAPPIVPGATGNCIGACGFGAVTAVIAAAPTGPAIMPPIIGPATLLIPFQSDERKPGSPAYP